MPQIVAMDVMKRDGQDKLRDIADLMPDGFVIAYLKDGKVITGHSGCGSIMEMIGMVELAKTDFISAMDED